MNVKSYLFVHFQRPSTWYGTKRNTTDICMYLIFRYKTKPGMVAAHPPVKSLFFFFLSSLCGFNA